MNVFLHSLAIKKSRHLNVRFVEWSHLADQHDAALDSVKKNTR